MWNKLKKQFQHGVRIGFSLQQYSLPQYTLSLRFIGQLCSRHSKLGLTKKFGLARQELRCSWFAGSSQGILEQGSSSCWDHLSWRSFTQDSLKWHQLPQRLALKQGTDKLNVIGKSVCPFVLWVNIFPPQFVERGIVRLYLSWKQFTGERVLVGIILPLLELVHLFVG